MEYVTHSADETIALGCELGQKLPPNSILCFFGDLGAGKTTLIKGIIAEATGTNPEEVNSPTFVYLNIYSGPCTVYHFDLYRLSGAQDFFSLGFEEYFSSGGICCIEWSERIASHLPPHTLKIAIEHAGVEQRHITIQQGI